MAEEVQKLPAAGVSRRPCGIDRDAVLRALHNKLCSDLDRIKKRFIGNPKVALVVRFDDPEKGIWLTDDTAESVIEYIRYMEAANQSAKADVFRGGRSEQGSPSGEPPQAEKKESL